MSASPRRGTLRTPTLPFGSPLTNPALSHAPTRGSTLRNALVPSSSPPPLAAEEKESEDPEPSHSASTVITPARSTNSRAHRSPTKTHHTNTSPDAPRRVGPTGSPLLPAVTPSDLCAFCQNPAARNLIGRYEDMVSCWECGSSGHPTCLDWADSSVVKRVGEYCWLCQDCKRCGVCDEKGEEEQEDDNMLLCDRCDRGWHRSCLTPPMTSIPRGKWTCPTCQLSTNMFTATILSSTKRLTIIPPSRSNTPLSRRSHSVSRSNRKGKGRARSSDDGAEEGEESSPWGTEIDDEGDTIMVTGSSRKDKGKGRAVDDSTGFKLTFRLGTDEGEVPEETPRKKARPKKPEEKEWLKVREIEEEEDDEDIVQEEEEIPYGGILVGEEAEVGDRVATKEDRKKWERARDAAEAKIFQDLYIATAGPPTPPPESPAPPEVEPSTPQPSNVFDISTLAISQSGRAIRERHPAPTPTVEPDPEPPAPTPIPVPAGGLASIPIANIKAIRFGEFEISTWYQAPFPEEYSRVPDGRLWICEFCLKYMKGGFQQERHRLKCKTRHPPGDEIYRDGQVSVFEVDGRKNKIYCQNLCLLAKMFLDHKTLYYDVEPFLFYVMTTAEATGAKFVGYFSKEKRSPTNNVSCIMTLPVRQRKGWGNLLIDFSYLLSKKEVRAGTPERPLSDLGLLSYRNYWTLILFQYLATVEDTETITLEGISDKTAMTHDDIYFILKERDMIVDTSVPTPLPSPVAPSPEVKSSSRGQNQWTVRKRNHQIANATLAGSSSSQPHHGDPHSTPIPIIPSSYRITFDKEVVQAHLLKWEQKEYLQLKPEKLQWSPFLVTRGYGLEVQGKHDIEGPTSMGAMANGLGAYLGTGMTNTRTNATAGPSGERSAGATVTGTTSTTRVPSEELVRTQVITEEAVPVAESRDKEAEIVETLVTNGRGGRHAHSEESEHLSERDRHTSPSAEPFEPVEEEEDEDEDYEEGVRGFNPHSRRSSNNKRRRMSSSDNSPPRSSTRRRITTHQSLNFDRPRRLTRGALSPKASLNTTPGNGTRITRARSFGGNVLNSSSPHHSLPTTRVSPRKSSPPKAAQLDVASLETELIVSPARSNGRRQSVSKRLGLEPGLGIEGEEEYDEEDAEGEVDEEWIAEV